MRHEIQQKIIEFLKQYEGYEALNLSDDSNLMTSGVLDSVGFLEMILFVESEFQVELDLTEVDPECFSTLGGLVTIIDSHISTKSV